MGHLVHHGHHWAAMLAVWIGVFTAMAMGAVGSVIAIKEDARKKR